MVRWETSGVYPGLTSCAGARTPHCRDNIVDDVVASQEERCRLRTDWEFHRASQVRNSVAVGATVFELLLPLLDLRHQLDRRRLVDVDITEFIEDGFGLRIE